MPDFRDESAVIQDCLDPLRAGDSAARDAQFQFPWERLYLLTRKLLQDFPAVHRRKETDDGFQRVYIRLERAMFAEVASSASHSFRWAGLQIRRGLIDISRYLSGPDGVEAHQHAEKPRARRESAVFTIGPEALTAALENLARWTGFHPLAVCSVVSSQGVTRASAGRHVRGTHR